jgi:hypothetical protein
MEASTIDIQNIPKAIDCVIIAYIPDVITRPSGKMRIISSTIGIGFVLSRNVVPDISTKL